MTAQDNAAAISSLLDEHRRQIDDLAREVAKRDRAGTSKALTQLLTDLLVGIPGIGVLAGAALEKALTSPANKILQEDIAAEKTATDRRALTTEVLAAVEQMLGDEILLPLLRSASAANDEVLRAVKRLESQLTDRLKGGLPDSTDGNVLRPLPGPAPRTLPTVRMETLGGISLPPSGTVSADDVARFREHILSFSCAGTRPLRGLAFRLQLPELAVRAKAYAPTGVAATIGPERMSFTASATGGGTVSLVGDVDRAPAATLAGEIDCLLPGQTVRFPILTVSDDDRQTPWSKERDKALFGDSWFYYLDGRFLREAAGDYVPATFVAPLRYDERLRRIEIGEVQTGAGKQPVVRTLSFP
jgi:hypothetical protein